MKPSRNIYFINELDFETKNAAYKARFDICQSLKNESYLEILDVPLWGTLIKRICKLPKFLYYIFFHIKKNDIVIMQYPFPKPFIKIIRLFSHLKKFKISFLIHDVDILRGENFNEDIMNLNSCNVNISHNLTMSNKLSSLGITSDFVEIGLFDYLISRRSPEYIVSNNAVVYCGNLKKEKSLFIYDWMSRGFDRIVYGVNNTQDIELNNIYKGSFDPNSPPQVNIKNKAKVFGLVWDGLSVDECSGNYGEYLRYNNPHKTSLYLAMGIPIIIWKHAAISQYLLKHNVCITIDKLDDINSIFDNLTEEKYQELSTSVNNLRQEVINGVNTQRAVEELVSKLEV